ncbi:MAG TPA: hypothetical protein VJA26_15555 [Gammaproteobacteria bacterium]|nr:hypothetical protein [Gammaproteobacteria bacterium]
MEESIQKPRAENAARVTRRELCDILSGLKFGKLIMGMTVDEPALALTGFLQTPIITR